jgi:Flp pilus assembly protein TadB
MSTKAAEQAVPNAASHGEHKKDEKPMSESMKRLLQPSERQKGNQLKVRRHELVSTGFATTVSVCRLLRYRSGNWTGWFIICEISAPPLRRALSSVRMRI